MNSRQKAYDTYDCTSRKLKVLESLHHQQNLYLIKTRKAPKLLIINQSTKNALKKSAIDPINKFFKVKNDLYIADRLKKIKSKLVKPILNEEFIISEQKKKKHSLKVKELEEIKIKQENERMLKRMQRQHSFISTKEMDKNYNNEHKKMIEQLRKIPDGKLLLPNITQRSITHSRSITEATTYYDKINL